MKNKYNQLAKIAITNVITNIHPDDWDQRPDNICICGYHKDSCKCKKKEPLNRVTKLDKNVNVELNLLLTKLEIEYIRTIHVEDNIRSNKLNLPANGRTN